jgi:hypothetical protein
VYKIDCTVGRYLISDKSMSPSPTGNISPLDPYPFSKCGSRFSYKKKIRAENRNFYDWRIFKYIFYEKFCYFWRNFVSCIPRSSFATKNNKENFRDHPTIIGLHYQKNIYKNILIQRNFKESLKKFEFKYILHDILLF